MGAFCPQAAASAAPATRVGYLAKNAEVFSPPYLFKKDGSGELAPRPQITSAPGQVTYNAPFAISTPNAASISKVALVRLGAVTHSVNMEQRYVPLSFTEDDNGAVQATAPINANVAPPGVYMLFVIGSDGVPSVARMVRVDANTTDTTNPDTTIDSGPTGPTNDPTPTFTFSSNESGSTFKCQIDSGSFAACSSPKTPASLSDGPHTFAVRATDPAGNTDPSPATRSFTVNATAPNTTIDSGPTGLTNDNTPTFTFSSDDAGASFACFDAFVFGTCSGPGASHTIATLPDGPHSLTVTSIDSAGNSDPTPATRDFIVDTTAPDTTITKQPKGKIKTKEKSVTVKVSFESEQGAKFECKLDESEHEPCTSPYSVEAKSKGGKGKKHTISIQTADEAGNTAKPIVIKSKVIRKG